MNETQPVLPAEPWYTSRTQIAGVIAGLTMLASIIIRWFKLGVTDEVLQQASADILNLVTLAAGAYAMYKRQTSKIAPLAMTKAGADAKTAANPPLLDADPTKITK